MTAEEEDHETEMADAEGDAGDGDGGDAKKKQKRSKPRRQSGTAVAFQKRTSVRKLPERTTSSHLVERKGKNNNQLAALQGGPRQDRRGSQGAIKAATSAMRAARGVPAQRGVSRAASSQQAPRRPDRALAPAKKSVPARSSSTHSLKQLRRGQGQEPTLTGADLLNLRRAQKADNADCDSVQSDLESTYTMDSINLRKSQIHHHDDEELAKQMRDAGLEDEYDDEGSESVSTLQSTEDGIMTDFEALADVEVEDEGQETLVIEDDK